MNNIMRGLLVFFVCAEGMTASTLRETSRGPDTAPTVANIHAGIISGDGIAEAGIDLGIASRISDTAPLYLGANLGIFVATESPSYALIPLMLNLYYQFEPEAVIHPLLGVMAGPVLATGGGFSTVRLGVLFRPGVNIELGKAAVLSLEPRFGVLGSRFVFIPQVGAIFPI